MSRRAFILRGEGIECEEELFRFLSLPALAFDCRYVDLPRLFKKPQDYLYGELQAGDWVFFPGGFSFADHFGSGRLLSYLLDEISFFKELLAKGCHLFGICNGFQVLTQANLFGTGVRLMHNHDSSGRSLGFINQWVTTQLAGGALEPLRMSVRHGEGCLDVPAKKLPPFVQPFLFYADANFNNGSFESIAGLVATVGRSKIYGMMPHPEVSSRPIDDPNDPGPDFLTAPRSLRLLATGDGVKLMNALLEKENF